MKYLDSGKSSTIQDVEIKLDIYNHLTFVSPKNANQVIQLDQGVHQIFLYKSNDTLTFEMEDVGEGPQFARILSESDPLIKEIYLKIYRKADYKGIYSAGRTYDEFIPKNTIFLEKEGKLIKVKPSARFWSKYYPEFKSQIKKYWDTNLVKSTDSWIDFGKFLNNLVE